jgi:hypothetical protein
LFWSINAFIERLNAQLFIGTKRLTQVIGFIQVLGSPIFSLDLNFYVREFRQYVASLYFGKGFSQVYKKKKPSIILPINSGKAVIGIVDP